MAFSLQGNDAHRFLRLVEPGEVGRIMPSAKALEEQKILVAVYWEGVWIDPCLSRIEFSRDRRDWDAMTTNVHRFNQGSSHNWVLYVVDKILMIPYTEEGLF